MRTTVEITDAQRARLLELAARRGEKGFSGIVRAALEDYLDRVERRSQAVESAIAAFGTLREEGDDLAAEVGRIRERWR